MQRKIEDPKMLQPTTSRNWPIATTIAALALALFPAGLSACGGVDPEQEQGDIDRSPLSGFSYREREEIRQQELLEAVSERIRNLDLGARLSGVELDPDTLTVTVRWRGAVPQAVRAAVNQPNEAVTVRFEPARFTRTEMVAASRELWRWSSRELGGQLHSVSARPDGSGLEVEVSAQTLAQGKTALEASLTQGAGMPVTVKLGEPIVALSRVNDSSPWKGGAAMYSYAYNDKFQFCSTGFSVVNAAGYGRLLSAGHCYGWDPHYQGPKFWDGRWDSLTLSSSMVKVATAYDSMLFDPYGGTVGKVYGGPFNAKKGHPRYRLKVAGHSRASLGSLVATSGANSGEHRGLKVDATAVTWTIDGHLVTGMRAIHRKGGVAVVKGDSGGPVYRSRSDGRVGARGIISAGSGPVPCPATRTGNTTCFKRVYFVPIGKLLKRWGVKLEKVP